MKDIKKSEIKVGVTVILALIIFVLIFSWTKNISAYSDRVTLKIKFDSVSGLEKGDPVTISGLKKGFVDDVILEKNQVVVVAMMDSDVKIQKDATYSVLMFDLMGGKKIEINPGTNPQEVDYSQVQKGSFAGDIATAMAMFSMVQNDLVAVIKDFRITLDNLNGLMNDKNFTNDIKSSVSNLNSVAVKLNTVLDENRTRIKTLLDQGVELSKKGTDFFDKNTDVINDFLNKSKTTVESLTKLSEQVNSFMEETKEKKNNLGQILYDETIVSDIKTSLAELKELVKIFNEQLKGKGLKVDANIF